MAAAAVSSPPSSSPRLPSPPPFTEVQITPSSPIHQTPPPITSHTRRIRPGTKSRNIAPGPPLTDFSELDSAFQLQEHLSSLIASLTSPSAASATRPLSREDAAVLAVPPEGVEESLWCYELTRRLTRDLNVLIVALLNDNCTANSCPEMRASEWQYLCAVHESPRNCCAIDYSTHTLDQAATMLTSTRYFPSRLSLLAQGEKHLGSIFRRLYRIFMHAWFQHRHVFWEVEGEFGLYLFFKTVSDRYHLIPDDNLLLPPEAEGLAASSLPETDADSEFDDFDRGMGMGISRSTGSLRHVPLASTREENEEDDDNDSDEDFPDSDDSDEEDKQQQQPGRGGRERRQMIDDGGQVDPDLAAAEERRSSDAMEEMLKRRYEQEHKFAVDESRVEGREEKVKAGSIVREEMERLRIEGGSEGLEEEAVVEEEDVEGEGEGEKKAENGDGEKEEEGEKGEERGEKGEEESENKEETKETAPEATENGTEEKEEVTTEAEAEAEEQPEPEPAPPTEATNEEPIPETESETAATEFEPVTNDTETPEPTPEPAAETSTKKPAPDQTSEPAGPTPEETAAEPGPEPEPEPEKSS